jgi:uncharacterized protein YwqG
MGSKVLGMQNVRRHYLKGEIIVKETNRLQLPNKLEPYRAKLENSIKPFIRVTGKKGTTLLWESKFCGNPYVPIGYEYPKDKDGTPMKLLAQINFEEVPIISPFPNKGILQFYISPEDEVYGMNFNHPTLQENFKVIYLSDIIKDDSKLISNFSGQPSSISGLDFP